MDTLGGEIKNNVAKVEGNYVKLISFWGQESGLIVKMPFRMPTSHTVEFGFNPCL